MSDENQNATGVIAGVLAALGLLARLVSDLWGLVRRVRKIEVDAVDESALLRELSKINKRLDALEARDEVRGEDTAQN